MDLSARQVAGLSRRVLRPVIFLLFTCCLIPVSLAGNKPQRLSDWLSAHPAAADDYPLGLLWLVPAEQKTQATMKAELLVQLNGFATAGSASAEVAAWIAQMPVTGRVPVALADADWMRADLMRNPVIWPEHRVVMPKRPHNVSVLASSGKRCQVTHQAGALAGQYVAGCDPALRQQVDWVWMVQPDGRISKFGIAGWNAGPQDEPAPGAWLWVPARNDAWAERLSPKLTAFLATQGSAPETAGVPAVGAGAQEAVPPAMDVTANDWGLVGLMQTPTARMRSAGHASATVSRVYPYTRINFSLQPVDWAEVGFRYSSFSNHLYGVTIAGNQAYKDKSLDVKFRLLQESAWLPQFAIGLRDMTGTGLFSGEYMVMSKRIGSFGWGAFDWSLGLGWGYVGARGNVHNPLSLLSARYDRRPVVDVGQGGNFSVSSYFRGPAAVFGGMQYQSPWEPLSFKLEYDGNDYRHEPFNYRPTQHTPWNFGAVYQPRSGVELSLGLERGNTVMLGLALLTDYSRYAVPKLDDPQPLPVAVSGPRIPADAGIIAQDFSRQTGWQVGSVSQDERKLCVVVDDAEAFYWNDRIRRGVEALHQDVSWEIDSFSILQRQHGMPLVEHRIDRAAWVNQQVQPLPPGMQHDPVTTRAAGDPALPGTDGKGSYSGTAPLFQFEPGLGLNSSLGGANGFVLYQLYAEVSAKLHLGVSTWVQGRLDVGLIDNYNHYTFETTSNLPRVRTHIREYLTSSRINLANLQLTRAGKLSDNQYYSVYAGHLEMMFAGVGAEWLYRSYGSRAAFGVDVNRVRQREFTQHLGLLKPSYQTNTGHATLYWDTGWSDVLAKLSVGRYLAGDVGRTFDLSRAFRNGVRMGGFITRTNASAVQFGEGSYDKGLYLVIPFDVVSTRSSGAEATALWQPLIRDGGAKLNREVRLYDETRLLDTRTLDYRPADGREGNPE